MDFNIFAQWAKKELNIDLFAYKPAQLERRLGSLMASYKIDSTEEYIKLLKTNSECKQKFLDYFTINVTEFFRNPEQFAILENKIKDWPASKNGEHIRIWSAACSYGCEPYSIAILIDKLKRHEKIDILATDIDETILRKAKEGNYVYTDIRNIKKDELERYFTKESLFYKINDNIKSKVTFKRHDLIIDNYESGFDLIICRNVVIYFNQATKDNIYKKFYNSLKPGGLLFVGATETIYNYKDFGFEKESTFIYRKPVE